MGEVTEEGFVLTRCHAQNTLPARVPELGKHRMAIELPLYVSHPISDDESPTTHVPPTFRDTTSANTTIIVMCVLFV